MFRFCPTLQSAEKGISVRVRARVCVSTSVSASDRIRLFHLPTLHSTSFRFMILISTGSSLTDHGILGINILGNSSLVYSSFTGNMLNALFIYQNLAKDASAFATVKFSIMHSMFELGITKFKCLTGGLTLRFQQ